MQKLKPAQPVEAATPFQPRDPLTEEEIEGIVLAVKSAFLKLKNLYDKITPVFDEYGFRAPSAGVVARDLFEPGPLDFAFDFTRGMRLRI